MSHSILIRALGPRQSLFVLSRPVNVGWDESEGTTRFVIASKANAWGQPEREMELGGYASEILIFPATPEGTIITMLEVGGSYRERSFSTALEGMGFPLLGGEEETAEDAPEEEEESEPTFLDLIGESA